MQSILQWATRLVTLGCVGLTSCGGGVENETPAQQQAAVEIGDSSQSGSGMSGKSLSLEPDGARPAQHLRPIVNCVEPDGEGKLVAHFGYINSQSIALQVAVGPHNAFVPPPIKRGQPTNFLPGESDNVVSVAFDAHRGPLQWKLGQAHADALSQSPPCVPSFAGVTSATVLSDSEIALTWTAATDYMTPPSGIVYDICVSAASGSCAANFIAAQTTAAGDTSSTMTDLTARTAYFFVVRARNAVGKEDKNTVEVSAQTCAVGNTACNRTCTLLASDPANCGACGNACASGLCAGGQCCSTGQSSCNGTCTSLVSDPANCGACGNVCASGLCAGGQCCSTGQSSCNGTCTLLASDPANCGACGNACASGLCAGGQCCSTEQSSCNGTCTSLVSDPANCGSCGNQCSIRALCSAGRCVAPVPVPAAVTAGEEHTCALLTDGTAKCWGWNYFGQLGNGTKTDSFTPVVVSGLSDATAIAATADHTCALTKGGAAKCWGQNSGGRLGNGTTTDSSVPVEVSGLIGGTAIAAGGAHTCALFSDGTAKCWGYNSFGELGSGTTVNSSTPVTVLGLSGASAIAAGGYHTCALLMGGAVKCWGRNEYGELGNGTGGTFNSYSRIPVDVLGLSDATSIAAGGSFTCALLTGGTARCWGANGYGALGDGTTANSLVPVDVLGLGGATAIAAGQWHICALPAGGTVGCWGYGGDGELGNTTMVNATSPVSVSGVNGVTALTAGWHHTCALLTGGNIECWGANSHGELGDGTTTNSDTPVTVTDLNCDVCASGLCGEGHCCSNGQGLCGGRCMSLESDPVNCGACGNVCLSGLCSGGQCCSIGQALCNGICAPLESDPVNCGACGHICSNGLCGGGQCCLAGQGLCNGTCATLANDPANCGACGSQCLAGQVCSGAQCVASGGSSTGCPGSIATPIGGVGENGCSPGTISISAGELHICVVMNDGTVRCWGDDSNGKVGIGYSADSVASATPVPGIAGAIGIAGGTGHTCALLHDGTVRCWGASAQGELGPLSPTFYSYAPVVVDGIEHATAIAAAHDVTCALIDDGTVRCWGWSAGADYVLGDRNMHPVPITIGGLAGVKAIAPGSSHICALLCDGRVQCWGNNASGLLGSNVPVGTSIPWTVSGISDAIQISASYTHTCAVLADGTVKCWGLNESGQLGDGTTTNRTTPVAVASISRTKRVVAGIKHTCAVLESGAVQCWGSNSYGQLGAQAVASSLLPVTVPGVEGAVALAASGMDSSYGSTTCALLSSGTVICWGSNAYSLLGNGSSLPVSGPSTVLGVCTVGSGIATASPAACAVPISVSAGGNHSCAVFRDGTVGCWGQNSTGQLGNGTNLDSLAPTLVSGVSDASVVSAGGVHSCALRTDGTVLCWGNNMAGQLGNSTSTDSFGPIQVSGLPPAVAVSAGRYHTCAALSDGSVRCWGSNSRGQLSSGTAASSSAVPVVVPGVSEALAVSSGDCGTCALANGSVMCWGCDVTSDDSMTFPQALDSATPVALGYPGAKAVSIGTSHHCVVDSTSSVSCFGALSLVANPNVGLNTSYMSTYFSGPVPALSNIMAVSAGDAHTCVLRSDGGVLSWGINEWGQLGHPDCTVNTSWGAAISTPCQVSIPPAIDVSAGGTHSCAALANGSIMCWGGNWFGQLGDGTTTNRMSPVLVGGVGGPNCTLDGGA